MMKRHRVSKPAASTVAGITHCKYLGLAFVSIAPGGAYWAYGFGCWWKVTASYGHRYAVPVTAMGVPLEGKEYDKATKAREKAMMR